MGTQYSSDIQVRRITEGIQFHFFLHIKEPIQILNMKLFVIAAVCLAATVSAEADADAWYGYGGYLHQQAWPGARGPGFEGTCYGCRVPTHHFIGKREAEAEPYYGYGGYGYGGYGYGHGYGYGRGYGYGHYLGKRSADAEPHYGYGFYGYAPYRFGGVAGHPTGTSYTQRSVQG